MTMNIEPINATVMIVDDAPANLKHLEGLLKERGYKTRSLPTGELALRSVRKDPPDLILLDINLPGIDGFEVCRRLKEDNLLKDIPVIFISILEDPEEIVRAFKAGGVDYIRKPFNLKEVMARVHTHLMIRSLIAELQGTREELKHLQSLLPICSSCRKIRGDPSYMEAVENYMNNRDQVLFSKGICQDCAEV